MKAASTMTGKYFAVPTLLIVCVFPQLVIASDDFEAYKKQQQMGAQKIKAEFQEYKEKQDQEFADFLKGQWSEFDTFRGKVRIKEPKPRQIPVVTPAAPVSPAPSPIVKVPAPEAPVPEPIARIPAIQPVMPPPPPQPNPIPLAADMLEIMFYGNAVRFTFDPKWKSYRLSGGAKPEAMSTFWTMMSGSKYEPTIQAINDARRDLKLDDWGGVTLWRSVVQSLQAERKSEQNLLLWYFLVKSGYDVRLGYAGDDVHLFVAMKQPVYATKYTKVGDQTYYAVLAADHGDNIRSFYTYEASYPNKLHALDIKTASTSFTKTVSAKRVLAFEYKGKKISLNVPYDRRLVEYFESFPQSEFELYFDTDGSSLLRHGLLDELKKYTATMGEEEAVDFLLAFVQKSFAYKTDNEQFGHEKYFFVEESLYFPYNDCEDRAVMFAWLVRELVGIKVIGLLYPGHMTTAVALKQVKSEFSTVTYRGSQYVIADPTYIGATIGMPMPSYAKLKPSRVVAMQ
ncbi:MAG TPA: hypothetical protein VMV48_03940 [Gallionellaceae bacterium]|nr:hypothetical protein [Gallionellaceae bacterium]